MLTKELRLNHSQAKMHIINANTCHVLGPRGSGKTEGGSGPRIIHLSEVMPRSQIIYYSDTYNRIHDRLIPNTMNFISNEMGLVEDEDYVMFKKPPDFFEKPLIPVRKYEHVVSFKTGLALCCASAQVEGSANGYNGQAAIIEETKYVKQSKIKTELYKALRGQLKYFGHLPEYKSVWSFTDKYEGDVSWLLELRDKQNPKLIQAILTMALHVIELQKKLAEAEAKGASIQYCYEIKRQILSKENTLNNIRKELVYVCEIGAYENIENLGDKFFRDAKRDAKSKQEYNVAILNKDPDKSENGYYPDLSDDVHYYDTTLYGYANYDDVNPNQPLIIACDYNWQIISVEIAQIGKLPSNAFDSLNTVGSTHALHPEGIAEAVANMTQMFPKQINKRIYYVYDNTAKARDTRGPLFELVIKALRANGWKVTKVYIGQMPDHGTRYQKIKDWLTKNDYLPIRINKVRAKPLKISLDKAGARTSNGKTIKDKRTETDGRTKPEHSTHHSEAFDQLLIAVLHKKLIKRSTNTIPTVLKANG